jgi:hypothetical protein
MVLDLTKDILGDYTFGAMVLNSETGREVSKAVTAGVLYFLVKSGMTPDLPVSDAKISRVLRIVERNAARNVIRPHMKTVRSYIEDVADIAQKLPEEEE